jgi:hypothetical protein
LCPAWISLLQPQPPTFAACSRLARAVIRALFRLFDCKGTTKTKANANKNEKICKKWARKYAVNYCICACYVPQSGHAKGGMQIPPALLPYYCPIIALLLPFFVKFPSISETQKAQSAIILRFTRVRV